MEGPCRRDSCPTCGGPVVVHVGHDGTSHMVPANTREHTEAVMENEKLRRQLAHSVPCDDAAIERAAQAASVFDGFAWDPAGEEAEWYLVMARRVLEAAGETP